MMGTGAGSVASLLIAVLALVGCNAGSTSFGPGVAARIDGDEVGYSEFESYVERTIGESSSQLESTVLSALFQRYIEQQLIRRIAASRGLVESDASDGEAGRALLADLAGPVSDDAVATFYRDHGDRFERAESIRLRQILVDTSDQASDALAALEAGESFDSVWSRFTNGVGSVGGRLGELTQDDLPLVFADEIVALEPGQHTGVLEAEHGFHIFLVEGVVPAGKLSLDEVSVEIRDQLQRESAQRALEELISEAWDRYNVVLAERNLPFEIEDHP